MKCPRKCLSPVQLSKRLSQGTFSKPLHPRFQTQTSFKKNQGGWKTQGRGKYTIKPLPKNGFGPPPPPPTYDAFPPPRVCSRPAMFLGGNSTDQTNPTLS